MFNVDSGLILNINYNKSMNNVTILTSKHGIKIVTLLEIKRNLNKYNIFDYWIFIFNENYYYKNWCLSYKKVKKF